MTTKTATVAYAMSEYRDTSNSVSVVYKTTYMPFKVRDVFVKMQPLRLI